MKFIGSSSSRRSIFPLGKHEFPFTFTLPDRLPTSFDGANHHGSIRYFVKVENGFLKAHT